VSGAVVVSLRQRRSVACHSSWASTRTAPAAGMLTRALNAGVPARWVAGGEVYGADPAGP
jgi:hypothetical protein